MKLPQGTIIAVADGEKLNLFQNTGDEATLTLAPMPTGTVDNDNKGGGTGHQSSSANPDASQVREDNFAAGIADLLNRQVLEGHIKSLVIIAAPRTLGELRKQYHKKLLDVLVAEVSKDLTGHSLADISQAVEAAA